MYMSPGCSSIRPGTQMSVTATLDLAIQHTKASNGSVSSKRNLLSFTKCLGLLLPFLAWIDENHVSDTVRIGGRPLWVRGTAFPSIDRWELDGSTNEW